MINSINTPQITSLAECASEQGGSLAVEVSNVGKQYRIYNNPQDRLKQMLFARLGSQYGREFFALQNVSLTVLRGEMVGIIGRNGSGKSTLLQIIAGTLAPSQGSVQVFGRVAALLELGSGFNPEFTGRENVFLNGSILGLSQSEMEQRYQEIVEFADIGEFIEQPVKTYSSGMIVRLAFAVQACIEPDILIVDEALAVGDVFFQQKCYRRLEALRERGTSILLVTHNLGDVKQYCQRAIVLHQGIVRFEGSASDAVAEYLLLDQEKNEQKLQQAEKRINQTFTSELDTFAWPESDAFFVTDSVVPVTNGWAECTGVALCDEDVRACRVFHQGDIATIFYEFRVLRDIEVPIGGMDIFNSKGVHVHGRNTLQYDLANAGAVRAGNLIRFSHKVHLDVAAGEYTLEVGIATISNEDFDSRSHYPTEDLYNRIIRISHLQNVGQFTVLLRRERKPVQVIHWGVAYLPGDAEYTVVTAEKKSS